MYKSLCGTRELTILRCEMREIATEEKLERDAEFEPPTDAVWNHFSQRNMRIKKTSEGGGGEGGGGVPTWKVGDGRRTARGSKSRVLVPLRGAQTMKCQLWLDGRVGVGLIAQGKPGLTCDGELHKQAVVQCMCLIIAPSDSRCSSCAESLPVLQTSSARTWWFIVRCRESL